MRIYWSDREGNATNNGCAFQIRPFFPCNTSKCQADGGIDLPKPQSVQAQFKTTIPSKKTWIETVHRAKEKIQKGILQKVVLSRAVFLDLKEAVDPFALAHALQEKSQNSYVYCIEEKNRAFLGATPELLFSRKGRMIQSEALAGTRKRGKTLQEDQQLEDELLQSKKDQAEFLFVEKEIQSVLSPFCLGSLQTSPIHVRKTQNVQHLCSQITGILSENITDETLIHRLHPTPALAGLPKKEAFSFIQAHEQWDRFLFGGCLGRVEAEGSEWIVMIRSCMLEDKTATLFSAAGIVIDSDPEKEWEELDHKIKLYEGILDY